MAPCFSGQIYGLLDARLSGYIGETCVVWDAMAQMSIRRFVDSICKFVAFSYYLVL